jgi:hypothetical protein
MLPPLGLNLFISSFRFDRPVVSLYRVVLPFAALVALGLALVMYVPPISTALIAPDIARARAEAAATHAAPRDAWQLECVQEDPSNPHACTASEAALYATPSTASNAAEPPSAHRPGATAPSGEQQGDTATDDDALFRQMLGATEDAGAGATADPTDDELFRQMVGAVSDAGAR